MFGTGHSGIEFSCAPYYRWIPADKKETQNARDFEAGLGVGYGGIDADVYVARWSCPFSLPFTHM